MVASQPRRDRLQELVADAMAEGVVDVLESVEIDEQDGNRHLASAGSGKHLLGPVEDQGSVRQPGQRVMDRLITDLVDQSGSC